MEKELKKIMDKPGLPEDIRQEAILALLEGRAQTAQEAVRIAEAGGGEDALAHLAWIQEIQDDEGRVTPLVELAGDGGSGAAATLAAIASGEGIIEEEGGDGLKFPAHEISRAYRAVLPALNPAPRRVAEATIGRMMAGAEMPLIAGGRLAPNFRQLAAEIGTTVGRGHAHYQTVLAAIQHELEHPGAASKIARAKDKKAQLALAL